MSKHANKVAKGLAARQAAHQPTMPSGQECHKPGSQNIRRSGTGHKGTR